MSGKTDAVKSRIKEAAGALTGNDEIRTEGKTDQAIGKVKQVAEKTVDKVEQVSPVGNPAAVLGGLELVGSDLIHLHVTSPSQVVER